MSRPIRLQKHLSRAGIASRRRAEALIQAGRVQVNGAIVRTLGVKVDPDHDIVTVNGRPVQFGALRWVALHKPRGYVSTRHDPQGRPTIYDLLPDTMRSLFTVGRLDVDSEGLLLLTNDGDAAHRLLHPRFGVDRVYEIGLRGQLGAAERLALLHGVRLDDGIARAISIRRVAPRVPGTTGIRMTLREGRKREVRRMLAAVGQHVVRLRRVRYGPISLGALAPGEWRELAAATVGRFARGKAGPEPRPVQRQRRRAGQTPVRAERPKRGRTAWRSPSARS